MSDASERSHEGVHDPYVNGRNLLNQTLPVQSVAGIVILALTMAGSVWWSTAGLRSDVRDINTKMDARQEAEQLQSQLEAERSLALKESLDAMKRRQELQQYEIQGLKEAITSLKGRSQ